MSDTKYNGWTNYATWRVMLEVFDGLEFAEMFALDEGAYNLSKDLQNYAEELIEMSISDPHAPSLAKDYALAFLSEVNWHEIANHIINDYAEQN